MFTPGVLRKLYEIILDRNHDNCISPHLTVQKIGGGGEGDERERWGAGSGQGDLVMGSFKASYSFRVSLVFSSYIT